MMEAIRSYLTAVVAVSMIAVLASALAHGSRMERVVRFAAGLLALLVCVTPLLRLDARTLTDVRAYNHANGWMWIAYSVPFWLSAALGWKLETLGGILLGLACTVGLALVFWCYRRILKRYSKRS